MIHTTQLNSNTNLMLCCKKKCIMNLNADCIREIAKFIHDPYDIARFSCVNRTCRDAMKHPAEVRVRVRHKDGLQHVCKWVHKNISHCRTLVVYGDCHLWSMFWRYLPVTIAPYLENIELVHDQEHKPLLIPSIEDVAPICENLQMLDVVALHSVHLGSGISRYPNIWSIDVTCPIIQPPLKAIHQRGIIFKHQDRVLVVEMLFIYISM